MRPQLILLIATAAQAAPTPLHHLEPDLPRAINAKILDADTTLLQRDEPIAKPAPLRDTLVEDKHEDSGGDVDLDEEGKSSVLFHPCEQFIDLCSPMVDSPCVIL